MPEPGSAESTPIHPRPGTPPVSALRLVKIAVITAALAGAIPVMVGYRTSSKTEALCAAEELRASEWRVRLLQEELDIKDWVRRQAPPEDWDRSALRDAADEWRRAMKRPPDQRVPYDRGITPWWLQSKRDCPRCWGFGCLPIQVPNPFHAIVTCPACKGTGMKQVF